MQEIILKKNLSKSKMGALIQFLKSWDIEAEVKSEKRDSSKPKNEFSLSTGLWKDNDVDGKQLREQAWGIKS